MKSARRLVTALVGFPLAASALVVVNAPTASSAPSTSTCARVVIFGLRGTGDTQSPYYGETVDVVRKVKYNFTRSVRSQSLTPTQYPAVAYPYWDSVAKGVSSLRSLVSGLVSRCGSATDIVLVGYSQGAHVIGDVLDNRGTQLSSSVNARIKAVVLYGDPTFRRGEPYNRSSGTLTNSGRFARPLGDLSKYSSRIRSYCNPGDAWCQAMYPLGQSAHEQYRYKYDDTAYAFIKSRF